VNAIRSPGTTEPPGTKDPFEVAGSDLAEVTRILCSQSDAIAGLQRDILRLSEAVERIERQARGATADPPTGAPTNDGMAPVAMSPRGTSEAPRTNPIDPPSYARLVTRIRSVARTVLPVNALVVVVSRGDDALLDLDGRIAWHFPRLDDGRWAGHHPQDSTEAIAHLERLRRQGARYLLVPATALWWLTHYQGFADHLTRTATPLVQRDDTCLIFALRPQESS
jgi:hypothetical protein